MKKLMTMVLTLVMVFVVVGCNSGSGGTAASNSPEPAKSSEPSDSASPEVQEPSGKITLYTSESQDLVNEMISDFKSKHPKVEVDIFRGGTGQVISKMDAEHHAGKIQADVIWFADIEYFHKLAKSDMLEQYDSPNAADLSNKYKYENGKYYEIRQIFNVMGYNTAKLQEAPKSWNDLHNPDLKGKIAIANPNYSGAAFQTLATFVQEPSMGWDYFTKLKENTVKFEQSNGNLTSKLSSGEYWAVSVVDFMIRNAKAEGSPVDVVWPEEGAILIPTPVGILSSSENKPAAQSLIDYLLSEEGQKFFVKQGYIPVKDNVGSPEGAPNADTIKVFPIDLEFIGQNREDLKNKFGGIFAEAK